MNIASPLPSADERRATKACFQANALHDRSLVRRFQAGDEAAFTEIAQRHRAPLFQVAFALLRDRADAEEIAQDALIRAHRALARFRGDASLATWLHCITRNLAHNRYWYFFRRRRHLTESLERPLGVEGRTSLADMIACDAPSPVREASHREFSNLVTECMGKLTDSHREILELRNVRRESYHHIAATLGIGTGTVKSRVARARENLRALLVDAYASAERSPAAKSSPWFESVRSAGGLAA